MPPFESASGQPSDRYRPVDFREAQNLLNQIYPTNGDQSFNPNVRTADQTRQLTNASILPDLSIAWVQENQSRIDTNHDGYISRDELIIYADGLDGRVEYSPDRPNQDPLAGIQDPIAKELARSFLNQYDELIAMSYDGNVNLVSVRDVNSRMVQINFVNAYRWATENDPGLLNIIDTAGYGNSADGQISWQDIWQFRENVNNGYYDGRDGRPLIDAARLQAAGLSMTDLQFMLDHWDDRAMSRLTRGHNGLIDVNSVESTVAFGQYGIDSFLVERNASNQVVRIDLPNSSGYWQGEGDNWTYFGGEGLPFEDSLLGPPDVSHLSEGFIRYNHQDGSRSDVYYDTDGNITQVRQTTTFYDQNGQRIQPDATVLVQYRDGAISQVTLPDGSTVTKTEDGRWQHVGTNGQNLGIMAGAPYVHPDGTVGFDYPETMGDTWKVFGDWEGGWRITTNLGTEDHPADNPANVITFDNTFTQTNEQRFPSNAIVYSDRNGITQVRLPDGSLLVPNGNGAWLHMGSGGQNLGSINGQIVMTDGNVVIRNGDQVTPVLSTGQSDSSYRIPLANGVIEIHNADQSVTMDYPGSSIVTFDSSGQPKDVRINNEHWTRDDSTVPPTWRTASGATVNMEVTANGTGVNITFTDANIRSIVINTSGDVVNTYSDQHVETIRANGQVERTNYSDGHTEIIQPNGERTLRAENGIVSHFRPGQDQPYRIDCPNGQNWRLEGEGDNRRWILSAPDGYGGTRVTETGNISGYPVVNADGTITVTFSESRGDSTIHPTATYTFDATGALDTIVYQRPAPPPSTQPQFVIMDIASNGQPQSVTLSNDNQVSPDDYTLTRTSDGIYTTSSGGTVRGDITFAADGQLMIGGIESLDQESSAWVIPVQVNGQNCLELRRPDGTYEIQNGAGDVLRNSTRASDGSTLIYENGQLDSVRLANGITIERRDDGTWITSGGAVVPAPIVEGGRLFARTGQSPIPLTGQLDDGTPIINTINPRTGVIESYDSSGHIVQARYPGNNVTAQFNAEGQLVSATIQKDGVTFTYSNGAWLCNGNPTTTPPEIRRDGQGHLEVVVMPGGSGGATFLRPNGDVQQVGLDGTTVTTQQDGTTVSVRDGITTTRDSGGNVIRIERGNSAWYLHSGTWMYHSGSGNAADVALTNIVGTPTVANGEITVTFRDGTATYSYGDNGSLESITYHRTTPEQYVLVEYNDAGAVRKVTISSDATFSSDDECFSADGNSFYSDGGRVRGTIEFTPDGILLANGQPVLDATTTQWSLPVERDGVSYNEVHFADGAFRVTTTGDNPQLVAQRLSNNTYIAYSDGQPSEIRLPSGPTLMRNTDGTWYYTTTDREGTEVRHQVAPPVVQDNLVVFNTGNGMIPAVRADGRVDILLQNGLIVTAQSGTEQTVSRYSNGRVVGISDTQVIIEGTTYTWNATDMHWYANGVRANVTVSSDSTSITAADGSIHTIFANGETEDRKVVPGSPEGAPQFITTRLNADGNLVQITTPDGSVWRKGADNVWTLNGTPQPGVVGTPSVNPETGSITINFGNFSTVYRYSISSGQLQISAERVPQQGNDSEGQSGGQGDGQASETPVVQEHNLESGETVYDVVRNWLIANNLPHSNNDVMARCNQVMEHSGFPPGSNWNRIKLGHTLTLCGWEGDTLAPIASAASNGNTGEGGSGNGGEGGGGNGGEGGSGNGGNGDGVYAGDNTVPGTFHDLAYGDTVYNVVRDWLIAHGLPHGYNEVMARCTLVMEHSHFPPGSNWNAIKAGHRLNLTWPQDSALPQIPNTVANGNALVIAA